MKIAQVILESGNWGNVGPDALEKGIGGREGALIRLATEWAKLGHEVTNFVPADQAKRFNEGSGFHEYVPAKLARPMLASFPYDAVVAWECPNIYDNESVIDKQKVRLIHMQVAHMKDMDLAAEYSTGVVALSKWAQEFLVHSGLHMTSDKLYVRPNGIDITQYPDVQKKFPKDNLSVVYSSSPDRGLWHLLKIWPEIRKEKKKANLFVGYGVKGFTEQMKWAHTRLGQMSLEIEELMQQPGVIDLGKIGQKQLATLQRNASLWIYPADTIQATETGCITAIENMAAGNPCVMSDADCLEEEFGNVADILPLPFNAYDYYADAMDILTDERMFNRMSSLGKAFAQKRAWSVIAPTWIDLFKENRDAQK